MRTVKVIVEQHTDGFVAYPVGMKGVVVGEGDTREEALADVRSAIRFHLETFDEEALPAEDEVPGAILDEVEIPEDLLARWEEDMALTAACARLSEDALRRVWDNPEDAAYDEL